MNGRPDPLAALEAPAVVTVPALLSVARVAELLDCSPQTVRRRIAEGALPAMIESGRLVVRGDDLRAYVDGLPRVDVAAARRRRVQPRAAAGRFGFLRDPSS